MQLIPNCLFFLPEISQVISGKWGEDRNIVYPTVPKVPLEICGHKSKEII